MLWAICFLLLAIEVISDDEVLTFEVELDFKPVTYAIRESQLEAVPEWSPEEDFPPLSPRKAIEVATNGLRMLEKRGLVKRHVETDKWKLIEASLVPVRDEKWFWKMRFEVIPGDGRGSTGISAEATVVVLMDGVVLVPSRGERESGLLKAPDH